MYLSKKHKMRTWYGFDRYIFKAADKFYDKFGEYPNMVVFNDFTYEQICWLVSISPKREGILNDEGEEIIEISKFNDKKYSLQCGTVTEGLKDREFELVYNDDTDDDEDNDNETKEPEPEPPVEEAIEICLDDG
jgi:hypothetical protein